MADFTNALLQGFNFAREARREDGFRKALSGYVANPSDQGAADVARYNPQAGYEIGQDRRRQQQAALDQGKKAVGQAALLVAQLPPEQQAAAWDSQIEALVGQGYDGLAQYRGKYSPDALRSVLAETGLASEYLKSQQGGGDQISITATQPGGSYVVRNNRGQLLDPKTNQWITPGAMQGAPAGPAAPPPEAIDELRANPDAAAEFDEVFGPGAAERVLGQGGPSFRGVTFGHPLGGR